MSLSAWTSSFLLSYPSSSLRSAISFLVSYFYSRATVMVFRSCTSLAFACADSWSSSTCWDSWSTFWVAVSLKALALAIYSIALVLDSESNLVAAGISIGSTYAALGIDSFIISPYYRISRLLWSWACCWSVVALYVDCMDDYVLESFIRFYRLFCKFKVEFSRLGASWATSACLPDDLSSRTDSCSYVSFSPGSASSARLWALDGIIVGAPSASRSVSVASNEAVDAVSRALRILIKFFG